jgi:hypothetical protein
MSRRSQLLCAIFLLALACPTKIALGHAHERPHERHDVNWQASISPPSGVFDLGASLFVEFHDASEMQAATQELRFGEPLLLFLCGLAALFITAGIKFKLARKARSKAEPLEPVAAAADPATTNTPPLSGDEQWQA